MRSLKINDFSKEAFYPWFENVKVNSLVGVEKDSLTVQVSACSRHEHFYGFEEEN